MQIIINEQEKKILFFDNKKNIGWIEYAGIIDLNDKIENIFLLHNFYIVPEKRNIGLGKLFFKCVLQYFMNKNTKQIFLIPDPFEIEIRNNQAIEKKLSIKQIDSNFEKLVNFYSKFGFEFVNDFNKSEQLLKAFNFSGKTYRLMMLNIQNLKFK